MPLPKSLEGGHLAAQSKVLIGKGDQCRSESEAELVIGLVHGLAIGAGPLVELPQAGFEFAFERCFVEEAAHGRRIAWPLPQRNVPGRLPSRRAPLVEEFPLRRMVSFCAFALPGKTSRGPPPGRPPAWPAPAQPTRAAFYGTVTTAAARSRPVPRSAPDFTCS